MTDDLFILPCCFLYFFILNDSIITTLKLILETHDCYESTWITVDQT